MKQKDPIKPKKVAPKGAAFTARDIERARKDPRWNATRDSIRKDARDSSQRAIVKKGKEVAAKRKPTGAVLTKAQQDKLTAQYKKTKDSADAAYKKKTSPLRLIGSTDAAMVEKHRKEKKWYNSSSPKPFPDHGWMRRSSQKKQ